MVLCCDWKIVTFCYLSDCKVVWTKLHFSLQPSPQDAGATVASMSLPDSVPCCVIKCHVHHKAADGTREHKVPERETVAWWTHNRHQCVVDICSRAVSVLGNHSVTLCSNITWPRHLQRTHSMILNDKLECITWAQQLAVLYRTNKKKRTKKKNNQHNKSSPTVHKDRLIRVIKRVYQLLASPGGNRVQYPSQFNIYGY